jgi:hypothetical protein
MMSTEKKLQQIIDLMQRDESVDAPADSIRWASNLYKMRELEPGKSFVQKIAAVLQMEITPNKPAFGERSASTSQVRQMLFKAGDNAIDIRIEPKGKAFNVRGQILGEGLSGAEIMLFNDAASFESRADEVGEFAFDDVKTGEYQLVVQGENVEITLKTIHIE